LYSSEINYPDIFQNQLVIRTREKGNINYTFQNNTEKPIDEIITFNFFEIKNELLFSGLQVEESKLSINRTDTVLIEQFVITKNTNTSNAFSPYFSNPLDFHIVQKKIQISLIRIINKIDFLFCLIRILRKKPFPIILISLVFILHFVHF
jgi:hypothetical protein